MSRAELESFREVVEQSRPLLPSQAAVLRQVVAQAYLSGEPYPTTHGAGFLGVRMQVVPVTTPGRRPGGARTAVRPPGPGVSPRTRRRSAVAGRDHHRRTHARVLRRAGPNGRRPDPQYRRPPPPADRRPEYADILTDFSQTVRDTGPQKVVTFELLREGRVIRVPVRLDPRPEAADPVFGGGGGGIDELLNRRRQMAELYWNEAFRSLLDQRVG
jgi:hypothetical protein